MAVRGDDRAEIGMRGVDESHGKLLMIAYAFPPTGGPGVQRSAKFAKYLPRFGWLPTVWTVDEADGLPRDETLCDDLPPEVTICPRASGSGIVAVRRSLRGFANARTGEGLSGIASRFARAVNWRVDQWVGATLFPDDCIGWARRSVGPLLKLLSGESFEALYSTFSPASNHWLALELKRRTGLPWVADFRDLWTDDCRYRETSPQRRAAHRKLEQDILEQADAVIGVAPRQTQILAARVPTQPDKFITITNGFDPDDFADLDAFRPVRRDEFVLSFVGRFALSQTSEEWFAALRSFVERLGPQAHRFVFRVVGFLNKTAQAKLRGTGARCEFVGYLPHRDAIQAMCASDALLLHAPTGPNGDSVICAKLFEYLAARRPILLVGPKGGECERIVRACAAGHAVTFSQRAIRAALSRLFEAWKQGELMPGAKQDRVRRYSRVELTGQLAAVFDRVTGKASSGQSASTALEECVR
jgi:glycosyltransferase involved in cell wall biosynthesis